MNKAIFTASTVCIAVDQLLHWKMFQFPVLINLMPSAAPVADMPRDEPEIKVKMIIFISYDLFYYTELNRTLPNSSLPRYTNFFFCLGGKQTTLATHPK